MRQNSVSMVVLILRRPGWSKKIGAQLTAITKVRTIMTANAMVACLAAGGYKKIDVVTPYVDVTNERLKHSSRRTASKWPSSARAKRRCRRVAG